jgi:arylsulfatase A-like enzyme
MKLLNIPIYILSGAIFLAGCTGKVRKPEKQEAVNILFIFTDDQRWDALGYAGNSIIQTPTLDSLAARGTYFDNAFVTTAICCVSRASVLTGQYARNSGVHDFFTPIELETTYPRYLRDGGYYTGFIGKWGTLELDTSYFMRASDLFDFWAGSMGQSNFWHERDCNFVLNNGTTEKHQFLCDCPPDKRGFRGEEIRVGKANMEDPVHQETYVIPKKVRSFLDQRDTDKPFCLSISYKTPHGPWGDFDEKFSQDYEGVRMPVATSVTMEEAMSQPEFLRRSLNGMKNPEKIRTAHDMDGSLMNAMRDYYRLINGMDQSLGEILNELESRGLAKNTVVIFYSDNGQFMGEHGFGGKWLMYEESIRVPGFIYDPRHLREQARSKEMVLNIDLAPTILDYAGVDIPPHMDGKSLLPLLENPDLPFREEFFYEYLYRHQEDYMHIERSEGIRTREWSYIHYINQEGPESEELFNIIEDPLQMHDWSDVPDYGELLSRLREQKEDYFDLK